jgi:hypothetical protein
MATARKAEVKSFNKPEEVRNFPKGKVELVKVGGAMIGRAVFEPGWKWSTSVQPLVKTKSCEAPHSQYHISGMLKVVMDDGSEYECKAGDVSLFPTGHDAWVVGNEPVVVVAFPRHGRLRQTIERIEVNRVRPLPLLSPSRGCAMSRSKPVGRATLDPRRDINK